MTLSVLYRRYIEPNSRTITSVDLYLISLQLIEHKDVNYILLCQSLCFCKKSCIDSLFFTVALLPVSLPSLSWKIMPGWYTKTDHMRTTSDLLFNSWQYWQRNIEAVFVRAYSWPVHLVPPKRDLNFTWNFEPCAISKIESLKPSSSGGDLHETLLLINAVCMCSFVSGTALNPACARAPLALRKMISTVVSTWRPNLS